MTRKNFDTNEFEGKVKISGYPSIESILEKIDTFLQKYTTDNNEKLYDIEKETSSYILLNFHKNTEMANLVIRKLKLLQLDNQDYAKINCHLSINVISPPPKEKKEKREEKKETELEKEKEKEKTEEKGKEKIKGKEKGKGKGKEKEKEKSPKKEEIKTKKKEFKYEAYNINTKNNPSMNKLISHSLNFTRKNINKYLSPENNKMKIYESIFLGGPFIEQHHFLYKDHIKNKAQWINQKGFIPYISKETISKNNHTIKNYLSTEKYKPSTYNFREIKKTRWVGKADFAA